MKLPTFVERALQHERLNFVLTNRLPRRTLTRGLGWFSRIEWPVVRNLSIRIFELFAGDLHLAEAKETSFASLHDCFVRHLKEGARPVDRDPAVVVSPCDGLIVSHGHIDGMNLVQAKGSIYSLPELLDDAAASERFRGGAYVTLRLTASMYHRFHAPADCEVQGATFVSGDFWNVNPAALSRVARIYCRNERAILYARLDHAEEAIALVAVGAILVGSVQLSFVDRPINPSDRRPERIPCAARFAKGQEMGFFHHGSTIIVVGTAGLRLRDGLQSGHAVRVGESLMTFGHAVRPTQPSDSSPSID